MRHGAIEPPKQTVRRDVREFFEPGPRMTTFLSYVVGLWPLILILIISVAFLWSAGYQEP